jgi:ABC-type Fe3+/spermidine/putrescine transport system ATPase subunit
VHNGRTVADVSGVPFPTAAQTVSLQGAQAGQNVSIFLRPEAIKLELVQSANVAQASNEEALWGQIQDIIFVGSTRKYRVIVNDHITLTALETTFGEAQFAIGDMVHVSWKPDDCSVFA